MFSVDRIGPMAATMEEWWSEQFFGLDQGQRFVLLIIGIGCATGIIIALASIGFSALESYHRRRLEVSLKRELLDRGMSAAEIAQVVESTPPQGFLDRWAATSEGKGRKS